MVRPGFSETFVEIEVSIFDVLLKAFLEHLRSKIVPKAETFVKSCLFDTFVNPKFDQNVEHSSNLGIQTERRGAAWRGRGVKFDDSYTL